MIIENCVMNFLRTNKKLQETIRRGIGADHFLLTYQEKQMCNLILIYIGSLWVLIYYCKVSNKQRIICLTSSRIRWLRPGISQLSSWQKDGKFKAICSINFWQIDESELHPLNVHNSNMTKTYLIFSFKWICKTWT